MAKHGLCKNNKTSRLYNTYRKMLYRCYDEESNAYMNYWWRWIYVCDEWKNNNLLFFDWAYNNGWNSSLFLDRINNDWPYSPDNCRWTTKIINDNNRRTCVFLTINWRTQTHAQWEREYNLWQWWIKSRIKCGWKTEDLLLPSKRNYKKPWKRY